MTANGKTRVVLSIDENIWHEFQENLKNKGFPRGTASWIVSIFIFVLWIIGFIGAIQGEEKKVPLLGDLFQDWFKGI